MKLETHMRRGAVVAAVTLALAAVPSSPGHAGDRFTREAGGEVSLTSFSGVRQMWVAVAASGRVEARMTGMETDSWLKVRRGDSLAPLSLVRTRKRSRATMTRHGDVILIDPESQVTLPAGDAGTDDIRQESGNALYQIEPRAQGNVRVRTPYLVAGVKGTVFSVVISEEFASVSVVEGIVQVTSTKTGQSVELRDGDMALVSKSTGEMEEQRRIEERDERAEPAAARRGRERQVKASLRETDRLLDSAVESELEWRQLEDEVLWTQLIDDDDFSTRLKSLEEEDELRSLLGEEEQVIKNDDATVTGTPRGGTSKGTVKVAP